jgi:uncharacterized damage-inducible protein DinB
MNVMPPLIGDVCREHLRFMKWADNVLLSAVAKYTPDQIGALQHIYLGEMVWLRRVLGEGNAQLTDIEPPADVRALQRLWPDLHRGWIDWADSVTDWAAIETHRNSKGVEYQFPVWQVLFHLVNHGSYHRGQVSAMLRASGFAPPATDLIVWYGLMALSS